MLLFLFVTTCGALSTFQPTCTLPEETTNYVAGPPTRGTLQILWACLGTTIACVYTALHLNVPEQIRSKDWKVNFVARIKNVLKGLQWALITTLMPEVTAAKAFMDILNARRLQNKLLGLHPDSGWTMEHMLFADMGGFVVEHNGDGKQIGPGIWHCMGHDLVAGIKDGVIANEPPLTAAQLLDKSKSDLLAKLLASFQICYFVVDVIVRASRHLPVAQLELGTCALVPYTLAIYACSFSKPKGVATTITVLKIDRLPPAIIDARSSCDVNHLANADWLGIMPGQAISNGTFEDTANLSAWLILIPVFLSIPFGAIHLAAWNSAFPSFIDQTLWRTAAVIITAILPASFVLVPITVGIQHKITDMTMVLAVVGFIIARLIVLVEMFRCLAFLPPGGYIATWTDSVPHLG